MTLSLSLSMRRPKSPVTSEFSKRSFSKSRKSRSGSNTIENSTSSCSSSSILNDHTKEPFDLSIIVNQKQFDNFTSVTEVISKEETIRETGGKIKFQLNDIPNSEEKMSSRLIKGRKRFVAEDMGGDKHKPEVLDLSKPEMKNNQLLPSPLIRSNFPKSPYPFPPTEPTLLPSDTLTVPNIHSASRDRKQGHRRSRSFSELITSSSSINQPWRDRETWLSIYTPPSSSSSIQQRKGSTPSELENGGWRARGGGTFFGADMNGPYPSMKVRVKPLSPPTSPNRYFTSTSKKDDHTTARSMTGGCEPGDIYNHPTAILTPENSPKYDINKIIYKHKSHSAWNVRNISSGGEGSSSDESRPLIERYQTPSPADNEDDDEDLLPPLLPRTITRSSSFSSTSRNTTPIPWAQRSGTNSPGRQTPTTTSPPKTPSRQKNILTSDNSPSPPLRSASASASSTPRTWLQIDPSPPRSGSERKNTSPLITPRTPETPTRSLSRSLGGKRQGKKNNVPPTPSSQEFGFPFEDSVEKIVHQSPSKRFWKALKLGSPGKREEKKLEHGRDGLKQGPVSPTAKKGWF